MNTRLLSILLAVGIIGLLALASRPEADKPAARLGRRRGPRRSQPWRFRRGRKRSSLSRSPSSPPRRRRFVGSCLTAPSSISPRRGSFPSSIS